MNREIKFRGKRVFSPNEWVYGSLLLDYESEHHDNRHITAISYFDGFQRTAEVDLETVGQYTGLKDSNGVEIYEGDIVDLPHWEPRRWLIDYSVEQGAFYFRHQIEQPYDVCNPMRYLDRATVIGNIFENPELLG